MDEIVESIIERFLDEYPMSVSSSLSHSALRLWSADELDYLISTLEADAAPPRDFTAYVGDAGANVSPFFCHTRRDLALYWPGVGSVCLAAFRGRSLSSKSCTEHPRANYHQDHSGHYKEFP